ncbi:hypothetical protein COJ85_03190 [Bacillus sp. AFS076308]|uniref:hypothetical protein n=1 Tax=unclassified Bacillus (in: firmicutes) TaxID=185979 RepID=UPI000BF79183|nr:MULTISPECIES: hypothetical protein [unclassified Bacillus (in: firmicutes)]PFO08509.1 hypothetical protein COJ85_03190 [Bacillus sp. AFS076308]PGV54678.1 hypothetical protein COD92_03930 [Bacillus sp. AFS037270]
MNKRAIGALTMVLVGSVTFSLTNNLLSNQFTKQLNEVNNLPISDEPKTTDNIDSVEKNENNQTKGTADKITTENKTLKEQKPITERKNVDSTVSIKPVTLQAESNKTTAQVQNSTTTIRAASSATKTTAPVTTKTTTNQKTNTTTTSTKTTTKTAPTNSTTTSSSTTTAPANSTTTNVNHGQQVSQDAKAKATIRKDQKVNNGKKN